MLTLFSTVKLQDHTEASSTLVRWVTEQLKQLRKTQQQNQMNVLCELIRKCHDENYKIHPEAWHKVKKFFNANGVMEPVMKSIITSCIGVDEQKLFLMEPVRVRSSL